MKKIFVLIFLFCLLDNAFSQEKYKISGKILDKEDNHQLSNVNVLLLETNQGAISNNDGSFEIYNIPSGEYTLKISLIGFEKINQKIRINNNLTNLNFQIREIVLPGQTVIINAMRGKERVTPLTFQNYEKDELEKKYMVQDIPTLLSELPSTTFYSENGNGIGYNYINIRGFDQRRISVMINGIPQNDPEDHNVYWLDFPDLLGNLEDIQVQRGGGSAFYGPASIGGSINLVTSTFSSKKGISLSTGFGSYNTLKNSISMSSGLVDNKYSFFGKLSQIKSDGYRENSWSKFNSYFFGAIRYDENITTQIQFYGGPISDHLAYYGISKENIKDDLLRKENPIKRDQEIEHFSQPHYELLQELRLNENLILNHSLFFIEGEGDYVYDASWGDTSYFRMTSQFGFNPQSNLENALVKAYVHNKQFGWLPRVTYIHSNGELTAGIEYRKHNSVHWGKVDWADNLNMGQLADFHYYEFKGAKDIFSIYLHELYQLQTTTNLQIDLQYTHNKYRLYDEKFIGTDFSVPYDFINPRIGLNHNFNENLNGYFSIAYVSREPKLNNIYDAGSERDGATPQFELGSDGKYDYSKPLVKPENLLNLDLGFGYISEYLKSTLNLYLMDFRNEIVKSGKLDRFGQPITGNAEKTRHYGIEVSFDYKIINDLNFSGNFTVSKNTFIKNKTYIYSANDALTEVDLSNNSIAGFPDNLANLKLTYKNNSLFASFLLKYVGKQYSDNFYNLTIRPVENNFVDAYTDGSFNLNYSFKNILSLNSIDLMFQANNVFNSYYATHGEGNEFFPSATRNYFVSLKLNI